VEAALMLSVAVPPEAPTVAVAGPQLRPVAEQVSVTGPVNPADGVTVMVDVALAPGPETVAGVPLSTKPGAGAAFTVSKTVVEAVIFPVAASAPMIVTE